MQFDRHSESTTLRGGPLRLLVAAVLSATMAGALFAAEWTEELQVRSDRGNVAIPTRWNPKTGLQLEIKETKGRRKLTVHIKKRGSRILFQGRTSEAQALPDAKVFSGNLPTLADAETNLVLKLRPHGWWLYLRNQPVAKWPAPKFDFPVAVLQPESQSIPEKKLAKRFQKIAPIVFHADFMVDDTTKTPLSVWDSVSGTWRLHRIEADMNEGRARRRRPAESLQPERSPNFYSLQGASKGKTPGMFLSGYGFEDCYRLRASMQSGAAVGLVFYYQDETNYYTFGLEPMAAGADRCVLRLERRSATKLPRRSVLGRIEVPLTANQWVMPEVQVRNDKIECYLDNIRVLSVTEAMPPSGRFGLYVQSETPCRFDDVDAESVDAIDLSTVGDLRFHMFDSHGKFFPKPSFWQFIKGKSSNAKASPVFTVPVSDDEKWMVLGAPDDAAHLFEMTVTPSTKPYTVGLITGFKDRAQSWYRFVYEMDGDFETCSLEKVTKGKPKELFSRRRRFMSSDWRKPVQLRADGLEDGILRLYRDGELVLMHDVESKALSGGSGFMIGPKSNVKLSGFRYAFRNDDQHRNQFEKNRIFITDAFMRHWSSPEGEWYTNNKTGFTWHKSDFFGAFSLHMPVITGSEIHLGVEDKRTFGTAIITARIQYSKGRPEAVLRLLDGENKRRKLADAVVPLLHQKASARLQGRNDMFSVHVEDSWLWIRNGERVILKHQMPRPFKGTRIRIIGFATDQLKHSYTIRYKTRDFLFKQAQHDWTQNGGDWSVTNRFQCQPRWSHLTAIAEESLGAMWSKYVFSGDFCVELYAGMRHGSYERVGDLNLTIMNRKNTPSEGYTVTCTGWDFDHSQLSSKLYRNGTVVKESDMYAMPRLRDGNLRRYRENIVAAGRDVHGAWYYIKLRRKGKRIEYYFDDQLMMTWEDDKPIDLGSLGVWTYRNSIVIARVKVAAEKISHRPIRFRRPLSPPAAKPKDDTVIAHDRITVNQRPGVLLRPSLWQADDPVSRSRLSWHEDLEQSAYMVQRNVLGSGSFLARSRLPLLKAGEIAGFYFMVKRTPKAQFNFHFEIGKMDEGKFVPEARCFHQLSGTGFDRGLWHRAGATKVPASKYKGSDWHGYGDWTPVTVFLPMRYAADPNLLVKVVGFGNVQPSYVQQGLTGNAPGEAFAVKQFAIIHEGVPTLGLADGKERWMRYLLFDGRHDKVRARSDFIRNIQQKLRVLGRPGLNQMHLRVLAPKGGKSEMDLLWVQHPVQAKFRVNWSKDAPDTFVVDTASHDRRLAEVKVVVGETSVPMVEDTPGVWLGHMSRPIAVKAGVAVPVVISVNGTSSEHVLPLLSKRKPSRPALVKLDGLTPMLFNFDNHVLPDTVLGKRKRLRFGDPQQGTYVQAYNSAYSQRLPISFSGSVYLARYPVLQFRYRAEPSSQVSIQLSPANVRLGENGKAAASQVRFSKDMITDGKWHTWTGYVADATATWPLKPGGLAAFALSFRSLAARDQTGRYSTLDLDEVCLGPVVHGSEQLTFTPHYEDADGSWTQSVYMIVRSGSKSYHELSPNEKAVADGMWKLIKNGKPYTPDIAKLPDGIAHLTLKAVDRARVSSVVTDIPFIIDRSPPKVQMAAIKASGELDNGFLTQISARTAGGTPVDSAKMKFNFNGKDVVPSGPLSTHARRDRQDLITINWPYVLRDQLNQMNDGGRGVLKVTGIETGAGVPGEELSIPIRINHAADKRGPTLLQPTLPRSVNYGMNWYGIAGLHPYLIASGKSKITPVRKIDAEPYLHVTPGTHGEAGYLTTAWDINRFPLLAFQYKRLHPSDTYNASVRLTTNLGIMTIPLNYRRVVSAKAKLKFRSSGKGILPLATPYSFQKGVWTPVTIDVGALFREALGRRSKLIVKRVQFLRERDQPKYAFALKNLTILNRWSNQDGIIVKAYDASGIAGITWSYQAAGRVIKQGIARGNIVVPHRLGLPSQPNAWLRLQVRDKAGNPSAPLWVPVTR